MSLHLLYSLLHLRDINNSTTNKLLNPYSSFYSIFQQYFILYIMAKMVMHAEAQTFEISKLKVLLEKSWNPPEVTRIYENPEHNAITVSNLVQNWSISTQISYYYRNLAKWGTPNLLQQMLNKSQVYYWQK